MTTKRSREEITAELEALQGELDALDRDPVGAMIDDAIRLNRERARRSNALRHGPRPNPLLRRTPRNPLEAA